jgi:hypothetical protein
MVEELSPLQELRRHEGRGSTGEFIAVVDACEVHVFLQKGRVAWAVDSDQPLAFVRAIKDRCHLDNDVLREVIFECRRDRRSIAETLVRWGLASKADVREAMAEHLRSTLKALVSAGEGACMFLERAHFLEYDEALCFSMVELFASEASEPVAAASTARSIAPSAARASERPADAEV